MRKYINSNGSVLDIACGNGRFLDFLKKSFGKEPNYLGIDNSPALLKIGQQKHGDKYFRKLDVILEIKNISGPFDTVAIFGFMHHIPYHEFRVDWLKKATQLLSGSGHLIISFWQMDKDKRFYLRAKKAQDLEENDYYYNWAKEDTLRYVHIYDKNELNKLTQELEKANLKLVEQFEEDNGLNRYLVFKKVL